MQKPRLTIFRVAVTADFAEIRIPHATYLFSFSSLQPLRCHHFSQSTPRLAGPPLNKPHVGRRQFFLLYFFQRPFSKLGTGSLGRSQHSRFASSTPRYRICFEEVLGIKSIQGRLWGDPQAGLSPFPSCR
jgi:hypothetical protein